MFVWCRFTQEIHYRMRFTNRAAAQAALAQMMVWDKKNPIQIAYTMIAPYPTRFDRWMQRHALAPPVVDAFVPEIIIRMKSQSIFAEHLLWVMVNMAEMMVKRPEGVFPPQAYPVRITVSMRATQPKWWAHIKGKSAESHVEYTTEALPSCLGG